MYSDYVLIGTGLIMLAYASISDFRTREVPDWLSYSIIISGFGIRTIGALFSWDYWYLLDGLIGFGIMFALAHLLFYTGQWGGGDSKVLMGMGVILGSYPVDFIFSPALGDIPFSLLAAFMVNLAILGSVYGLVWSFGLAFSNLRKFGKELVKVNRQKQTRIWKIVMLIVFMIALGIYFYPTENVVNYLALSSSLLFVFVVYLIIFIKIIERVFMEYYIPVSKVTPGDWIVNDVVINGKRICGPKDLGISEEQIAVLYKLHKKGKISKVKIKAGIPFIPSFLFSYIFTIVWGNIVFIFGAL
ncbi:A24 family peptidase [Candidatus Woesearchaeota archaeon]|nr:A24 family peptidase [Candidatus Woesearchaeota archaeon]